MVDNHPTTNDMANTHPRGLFPIETYKTKLCKSYYMTSYCDKGTMCKFAHGDKELRMGKAPRNLLRYQTEQCKNFAKGFCMNGAACWYIHGKPPQVCPFFNAASACYSENGKCRFPHILLTTV